MSDQETLFRIHSVIDAYVKYSNAEDIPYDLRESLEEHTKAVVKELAAKL